MIPSRQCLAQRYFLIFLLTLLPILLPTSYVPFHTHLRPFTPIFDIMLIPFRFSPVAAVAAAVASIASVASVSSAYAQTEVVKPASAEEAAKTPSVPPSKKADAPSKENVQKVTISGGRSDIDERRQSTAAKLIFGREELDRNGDTNIGDVLKRLPGVTIGGRPGRGGDIRMRGMGNGYTQILINGERAPRGFSMDSLTPDQVERIEIVRGAVAEFSTQAIAGTINIVLREEYKQKTTDLKFSLGSEQGRLAPNLSITMPGEIGSLSYAFSGSVFQNRQHDESATYTTEKDVNGQDALMQNQADQTNRQTTGINLAPRLNYRFENGDTLMLQPFLMHSRSDSDSRSEVDQLFRSDTYRGTTPYALANANAHAETTFLRGFGNWQHRFENNAKLTVRFGGGLGKMDNSSTRTQFDTTGKQIDLITDVNNTRDSSLNTGGKYMLPYGEGHTLAAGWDMEFGRREQTRVSLDNGLPQFAESGDNLDARTRRLAAFVQDEFDINPQFAAYAGLRWEGIHTSSTTAKGVVTNDSTVVSPILQGVWRIPDSKDQIRLGFSSTYRAPALNDLIALPSISNLNTPTRPDRTGNPNLKPELSKGIDLAFEHYLSRAGIVSANLFVRNIDDLIRRTTEQVVTAQETRWVSSPKNIGHAVTKGIELEAKFQLQEFFPDAPSVDFRSNYSRFWSKVDDILGSNNRLDQQPTQTANFGVDYRLSGIPLTLGGNVNWTPAYYTQTTNAQLNYTGIKRQLDLYALWTFNPNLQIRLSANNLTANDSISNSLVTTGGINHIDYNDAKTYKTLTLRVEMKI
ncbi:TonB-dependent siderophore receptor [Undibacterium sp. CY21W]|uniref:TonB-dependent receptor plug domain-containing protein n=1 Tax=Undibacterium sp. CY21W TaxID=2762293 RepID=UPI0021037543|nr:TonB-dependent receptor [Undibacterium sp. CY21W]